MNTIVYILEKDDQDPCKTETKRELRKEKKNYQENVLQRALLNEL